VPAFTGSTFGKYIRNWLIGTAVFELLLAAMFLVIGALVPVVRVAFVATGAFLVLVGIGLIWFGVRSGAKAAEVDRIEATGIPGQATVVGLTQTGLFVNENPQVGIDLTVSVPGRAPFPAHVQQIVPLILLGRLVNGAILPVKVDSADPSKVVIEWGGPSAAVPAPTGAGSETVDQVQAMAAAAGLPGIGHPAESMGGVSIAQLRQYLRENGLSGTGTLDMVQDTGQTIGEDRVLNIAMTVHVGGKPAYKSESLSLVPQAAVPKAVLGASVPVKVAPDNDQALMIEWDRL